MICLKLLKDVFITVTEDEFKPKGCDGSDSSESESSGVDEGSASEPSGSDPDTPVKVGSLVW